MSASALPINAVIEAYYIVERRIVHNELLPACSRHGDWRWPSQIPVGTSVNGDTMRTPTPSKPEQWRPKITLSTDASDTGSIEVGKKADLVLFDTTRPEWNALHNLVNNLVYSVDGRSVHTVMVDGKIVVEAYKTLFVDEAELGRKVQRLGENLLARTGSSNPPR